MKPHIVMNSYVDIMITHDLDIRPKQKNSCVLVPSPEKNRVGR